MNLRSLQPGDVIKSANFDPELPPDAMVNRRAAQARGVRFDVRSGYYRDEEGRALYDYTGRPLR